MIESDIEDIRYCKARTQHMNAWERGFLASIDALTSVGRDLTPSQWEQLLDLVDKIQRAESQPKVRPITWREAYRGLRNHGVDPITSALAATVWVVAGVKVEE